MMSSVLRSRAPLRALLLALVLLSFANIWTSGVPPVYAAAVLEIIPISWNVIGLDSNNVNDGPNVFPIGSRVCNVGDEPATNVTVTWVPDDPINPYLGLQPGVDNSITLASLPAGTAVQLPGNTGPVPPNCSDFYFNIEIQRTAAAYDTTQSFHFEATADGLGMISTPVNRELYVEHLVSQERNEVLSITGETMVYVGQTYTYTVTGETAPGGYEQLVFSLDFPNMIFQVLSVSQTYSSPAGATNNSMYADACRWDSNIGPKRPRGTYLSCLDAPYPYAGGKAGGTITSVYTVKILGTGSAILSPLIYDFSGSSYHYNADYGLNVLAVTVAEPAIAIAKTPAYQTIDSGQTASFRLMVTNAGNVPLSNIQVTDAWCSAAPVYSSGDSNSDGKLDVTEVWYYDCTTSPVYGDFTNTASVSGTPLFGPNVTASSSAFVNVPPTLTVSKSASPTSVPETGNDVLFTFTVTNTSQESVTLTSLIDTQFGDLTGQGTCVTPQTIPAGGVYSCEFTRFLSGPPEDSHSNTVIATVVDDDSSTATGSDTETVPFDDVLPDVSITKLADPGTVPETGGLVAFTITVTNNSPEEAAITALTDSNFDLAAYCPDAVGTVLGAGQQLSCQFTAQIAGDFGGLDHTNTASVSVSDDDGNTDTAQATAIVSFSDVLPQIVVSKSPGVATIDEPGGTVAFTISIQNTSAEPVTLTTLADSAFGNLNGQGDCTLPQVIAAGAVYTCTFTGLVAGDAGVSHTNVVSAEAQDDDGNIASQTDDAQVLVADVLPAISVTKDASPTLLVEPGGAVTFTVMVTNLSIEPVTLTGLTDSVYGDLSNQGTCAVPQTIPVGGSYSCAFTQTVNGVDGDIHTNVVTAAAADNEQNSATAQDSAAVSIEQIVEVTKDASVTSLNEPGGPVTFRVAVTNPSNGPVTLTSLVDNVFGDLNGQGTCSVPQTIAAGASYLCSFTTLVSGNAGETHTDTITATVTDANGNIGTASDDAAVNLTDALPAITVVKTAAPLALDEPGGTATFTVEIHNLSVEPITLTSLADSVFGDLNNQGTCSVPQIIEVGGTYTCTFSGWISGDGGDVHTNLITASASDDEGNITSATDNAVVTIADVLPSLVVTKTASPTTVLEPGGDVAFTVAVENTSPEPVTLTALTDDRFGSLNGQGTCTIPQTIPAGGSYTCTFTQAVTGAPGDTHLNTVTAEGQDNEANPVSAADSAQVQVLDVLPSLVVAKTASPSVIAVPGGDITFTVEVTNTSAEAATLTDLTDSVFGSLNGVGTCSTGVLIPAGGTYTCTFTGAVTGPAGTIHTNVISATLSDNDGNSASSSDSATVTIREVVQVAKDAFPLTLGEPGGSVTFTVQVTNVTLETVTLTSLEDDVFGDLNGQGTCSVPQTIAAGAVYTCTFSGEVTGNAGTTHTDTITGVVVDSSGAPATTSDSAAVDVTDVAPTIAVTKTPVPAAVDEPGGSVSFSVVVSNTSPEAVTLTSLSDSVFGDLAGQGTCALPQTIAAGGSYSCTFTRTITGEGDTTHRNTVTARGQDDEGNPAEAQASADVTIQDILPTLTVRKTAIPASIGEPGGEIAFTVEVTNTSPESINLTGLVDDVFGSLNGQGTCVVPQTIPAGGDYTCTFTQALSGDAGDTHTDTVTATAEDNEGNPTAGSDSAQVDFINVLPALNVSKTAAPTEVTAPGGTATFTVAVENLSVEPVTLASLVDDVFGDLNGVGTCATGVTIPAGGTYTCSFDQTVSGMAGTVHTDTITAQVSDDDGSTASASDSATVAVGSAPVSVEVVKTAEPVMVSEPGGMVTFTAVITNTHTATVTLTALTDSLYGNLDGLGTCTLPQMLSSGAVYTCTFAQTVSGDAGTVHTNVITATVQDAIGSTGVDTDDAVVSVANVLPSITVVKSAAPAALDEPGGSVTFTVEVTNTSPEPVTLTSLTDSIFGDLNGQGTCATGGSIPAGESYTCTFSKVITGDPGTNHVNTITAAAADNEGSTASDDDDAAVLIRDVLPSVVVTKTPSAGSVQEPGGSVTFTVAVRNTAAESVVLTSLIDSVYGDLNGQGSCVLPQSVAPGASYTCTFAGQVTGDAGDTHRNTITASARDDDGNTTTAEGSADVLLSDVMPSLLVSKTAVESIPEPGGTVTFNVVVTNPSVEAVTLTSLSDSVFGDLNGQGTCVTPQTIPAGQTYTCSFDAIVTGAAGDIHSNVVTGRAQDNEGNPATAQDDASILILDIIDVAKVPQPGTLPEPGGEVTFTVSVHNLSNRPVILTVLTDSVFGGLDGQGTCDTPQTIAAGATYSCTFTRTITGDAGDLHQNTVTATVDIGGGSTSSDTAAAAVQVTDLVPTIQVSKTPSAATVAEPGGDITFTVEVANTSAEPLTLTSLSDSIYGNLDGIGTCDVPQIIATGGTYSCQFTRPVNGDAGAVHNNIVTAQAADNEDHVAEDSDDAIVTVVNVPPSVSVVKTASQPTLPEPGGNITFTVEVTNTGPEPISLGSLTDSVFGDLNGQGTCVTPQTIAPASAYTCTFTRPITGDAGDTHSNTITAVVTDNEGQSVSGSDSETVTIANVQPSVVVTKTAGVSSLPEPGGDVAFTVEVHNTSGEIVTLTTLSDDVYGDLNGRGSCATPQTLDPDEIYSCTFTALVAGNAGGEHVNTVTATVQDDDGSTASDPDDAAVTITDVLPTISVQKTAAPLALYEPGGDVTFTVVVANTSGEAVTLTTLADSVFGNLDGVGTCDMPQTIAAGSSYTCAFTRTISGSAGTTHSNTITATVQDDDGNTVPGSDGAEVSFNPAADLDLDKSVSSASPVLGATITYTLLVSNAGPSTATGVTVSDVLPTGLTFVSASASQGAYSDATGMWNVGSLASGASATLTIQATVAELGTITNTAQIVTSTEFDPDSTPGNADPDEDDQASVEIVVAPTADLELSKSASTETPQIGSSMSFTLTLVNAGPNTATGVAVSDPLPAGYTFVGAAPSQGTYDQNTGIWTVGTLTSGQTATLTLTVTVGTAGPYNNYAQVEESDQADPDSTPGDDSTTADDDATVTVTPASAGCVSGILFLDQNRNGTRDSGEPVLPDVRLLLFSGSTLVAQTRTDASGAYNFGNIAAGPYTVEIDVATLPAGTPVYLNPAVPRQTITVGVGGTCVIGHFGLLIIDPVITKNGSPQQASPGDLVGFTIEVTNPSTTTAISGVVVRDPLNGYLEFVSASTSQGSYSYDPVTHVVTFDLGTVAAGSTVTMSVTARVSAAAPRPMTISNQARVTYQNGRAVSSPVVQISVPAAPTESGSATLSVTSTTSAESAAEPTGSVDSAPSGGPTRLPETGSRPDADIVPGGSLTARLVAGAVLAAVLIALTAIRTRSALRQGWARVPRRLLMMALAAVLLTLMVVSPAAPARNEVRRLTAEPVDIAVSLDAGGQQPDLGPADSWARVEAAPTPIPDDADPSEHTGNSDVDDAAVDLADLDAPDHLADRLVIPSIDLDVPLVGAPVSGDTWDISGIYDEVAHLEGTMYPGGPGNAVLAGHVTHRRGDGPFLNLHLLNLGDIVVAEDGDFTAVYRVVWIDVAQEEDIEVTYPTAAPALTLITCIDWDAADRSYASRLIVRAELIDWYQASQ